MFPVGCEPKTLCLSAMDMMERRRAAQQNAEASAGETADEMLERIREDLQVAPAETAAPKAVTQGSEFPSVSGALDGWLSPRLAMVNVAHNKRKLEKGYGTCGTWSYGCSA